MALRDGVVVDDLAVTFAADLDGPIKSDTPRLLTPFADLDGRSRHHRSDQGSLRRRLRMAQPPSDDPSEIKEDGESELGSETRYFIELLDADPHHLAVGDGAHEYPERPTVEERQLTYQCSGGERPERAGSASPSLLADRFQRPLDDQVERPLGVVGLDDRLAGTEPPTAAVIEQERPVVPDAVREEVLLLLLGPDPLAPRRVVKEGH